jgi:hypothetical protein
VRGSGRLTTIGDMSAEQQTRTVLDPARTKILNSFFADGRLTGVPAKLSKRLVVLDELAQSFEPGVRYPEREVNEILRRFHDDYAALRRYLIDASFLSRSEGLYWRSGGSVEA